MDLPSYRWRFAHLAALWAYGVGQPVFSMLKGNPEFLVVRGSTRWDVIVFALLLAVVPPLVVVAAEALVALLSRTLAGALHVVAIWSFSFLVALQLVRHARPRARRRPAPSDGAGRARGDRVPALACVPLVPLGLARPAAHRAARLRRDGPAGRRRRGRRGRSRDNPHSGSARGVRRVPGELADESGRVARHGPVPELRTSRARRHVVPAGDHGARLHDARRPGDPHGAAPTEGRAADAGGSPGQPLHLAGRPVRASCQRAGDPALSVALLPTDAL